MKVGALLASSKKRTLLIARLLLFELSRSATLYHGVIAIRWGFFNDTVSHFLRVSNGC